MRKTLVAVALVLWSLPLFAQDAAPSSLQFRWDLLLRHDHINRIPRPPGAKNEFDRTRLQLRPGLLFTPNDLLTIEGRLVVHADTMKNDEFPLANGSYAKDHLAYTGRQDNFVPNSVALDRLNLQLRPAGGLSLVVGKFENPFDTTEALWDSDLQPEGAAASYRFGSSDGFHSRVNAGAYFGTQLYGDKSQIYAGQYSFGSPSSWPLAFNLSLGYTTFDNLDVLARKNWRSNRTAIGMDGQRHFVSDFEIGDALLRLHSERWYPFEVHVDAIRNFGADDQRDGFEAGLRVGQLAGAKTWRVSYVYQDLARDAVMDNFNGDDWYLHSWYRGSLVRAAVGVWRDFAIQGTYISFQHHETTYDTTRWMIDIVKSY